MDLYKNLIFESIGGSGGGGSLNNPKLIMTVVNSGEYPFYVGAWSYENGLFIAKEEEVPANETKEVSSYTLGFGDPAAYQYDINNMLYGGAINPRSNLVNCTEEGSVIFITDPTEQASITIPVVGLDE